MTGKEYLAQRPKTNRTAFLDMIAWAEGTAKLGDGGYNVMVGGSLFESYADHPRKVVHVKANLYSSAAGRYQLLSRYFDVYKTQLQLPDFGPESQDAIALQQIRESRALADIDAGRIYWAMTRCNRIWASLPGSPYGQKTRAPAQCRKEFERAGGVVIDE